MSDDMSASRRPSNLVDSEQSATHTIKSCSDAHKTNSYEGTCVHMLQPVNQLDCKLCDTEDQKIINVLQNNCKILKNKSSNLAIHKPVKELIGLTEIKKLITSLLYYLPKTKQYNELNNKEQNIIRYLIDRRDFSHNTLLNTCEYFTDRENKHEKDEAEYASKNQSILFQNATLGNASTFLSYHYEYILNYMKQIDNEDEWEHFCLVRTFVHIMIHILRKLRQQNKVELSQILALETMKMLSFREPTSTANMQHIVYVLFMFPYTYKTSIVQLGLKWKEVGKEKPENGVEFYNNQLVNALKVKHVFTQNEWDSFGIVHLTYTNFIRVDDTYFKPYTVEFKDIKKICYYFELFKYFSEEAISKNARKKDLLKAIKSYKPNSL